MKTPVDIITSPEMKAIHDKYLAVQEKNKQAAYNLFTLSSYNNQKENFHSDVIASLLSPEGKHNEGNKFLLLFIDFLNTHYSCSINQKNYKNAIITTEEERIDIWIRDEESKHCIIIESKINNANDRVGQIADYYQRAKNRKFEVDAAIYLTPDAIKPLPPASLEIEQILRKVPALSDSDNDLVHGWLERCYKEGKHPESFTLIYQYIALIKQLQSNALYSDLKYEYYKLISLSDIFYLSRELSTIPKEVLNNDELKKIHNTAIILSSTIYQYRRDLFLQNWDGKDTRPFDKALAWHGWDTYCVLFEHYRCNGVKYKLDIGFKTEGNVSVRLWVPDKDNEEGMNACVKLLTDIGMLDNFSPEENLPHSKMHRTFIMKKYGGLIEVDKELISYVRKLLKAMRENIT